MSDRVEVAVEAAQRSGPTPQTIILAAITAADAADREAGIVRVETRDEATVEKVARALSEHWRDMHTNESLGKQRMLAEAVMSALETP